jgi:hypothetical protein
MEVEAEMDVAVFTGSTSRAGHNVLTDKNG